MITRDSKQPQRYGIRHQTSYVALRASFINYDLDLNYNIIAVD